MHLILLLTTVVKCITDFLFNLLKHIFTQAFHSFLYIYVFTLLLPVKKQFLIVNKITKRVNTKSCFKFFETRYLGQWFLILLRKDKKFCSSVAQLLLNQGLSSPSIGTPKVLEFSKFKQIYLLELVPEQDQKVEPISSRF